ncbi:MAG: hypothetical protein Q9160_006052 [Pyrenula sp. 1 TL-2023]
MARGEQDRRRAPPENSPGPPRSVQVSKLLSRLLRHQAVQAKIPLSPEGYVKVSDALAWQRAKSMKITLEEIVGAVKSSDKQRFGLKYIGHDPNASEMTSGVSKDDLTVPAAVGEDESDHISSAIEENKTDPLSSTVREDKTDPTMAIEDHGDKNEKGSTTAQALHAFHEREDHDASHYLIRATQGHSIKDISSAAYLDPITLENASSIPETVVHGTFHAAWPHILGSGGLRPMTRTHIHFATGPKLDDIRQGVEVGQKGGRKAIDSAVLGGTVISGMRSDAQVLIYIDIRKALQNGIPFWRSENSVILSEGIPLKQDNQERRGISLEYFTIVEEIKEGVGSLWQDGKEDNRLPQKLVKKGMPRGKGEKFKVVMRDTPSADQKAITDAAAPLPKGKGKGKANDKPKLKLGRPGEEYDD